jgi:hypothetical protein
MALLRSRLEARRHQSLIAGQRARPNRAALAAPATHPTTQGA